MNDWMAISLCFFLFWLIVEEKEEWEEEENEEAGVNHNKTRG